MEWSRLVPEFRVTDLRGSLAFYEDLLGFTVCFSRDTPPFAYLDLDGAQIMISQDDDPSWQTGELAHPFGRGVNFQIEVQDVGALYETLVHAGWPVFCDVQDNWYDTAEGPAGNREFLVQDPDGYLLRFFEDISEG